MKKSVAGSLLALAGISFLALILVLRKPEPVQAPPAPPPPGTPVPVTPALPPLRPALPPPPEPADPVIARWRLGILQHSAKDVLDVQSQFIAREADYQGTLMTLAKDDPEPRIRAFTVAVLGRLKHPPAEEYFLERTSDPHEFPRISALEALEKLGTGACLETADRLTSADPVPSVRDAAAKAAKAVRSRGR